MSSSLERDLTALQDAADDLAQASYQSFGSAINRYCHRLRPDTELGEIVSDVIPSPDFDSWYTAALDTQGAKVGSARLDWPLDDSERVGIQLQLMRRMAAETVDPIQFSYTFTYVSNQFDTNLAEFVAQVFVPFHRDLLRVLESPTRAAIQHDQIVVAEHSDSPRLPISGDDRSWRARLSDAWGQYGPRIIVGVVATVIGGLILAWVL